MGRDCIKMILFPVDFRGYGKYYINDISINIYIGGYYEIIDKI